MLVPVPASCTSADVLQVPRAERDPELRVTVKTVRTRAERRDTGNRLVPLGSRDQVSLLAALFPHLPQQITAVKDFPCFRQLAVNDAEGTDGWAADGIAARSDTGEFARVLCQEGKVAIDFISLRKQEVDLDPHVAEDARQDFAKEPADAGRTTR